MTKDANKIFVPLLLAIIAMHLLTVLPFAYWLNLWVDEASTLYTTQQGFLHAFQHAWRDEKQAPLYFWIISLWRYADSSLFFVRLFSILCTTGGIVLVWNIARRFFSAQATLIAAVLFAFHPIVIWAALEGRGRFAPKAGDRRSRTCVDPDRDPFPAAGIARCRPGRDKFSRIL